SGPSSHSSKQKFPASPTLGPVAGHYKGRALIHCDLRGSAAAFLSKVESGCRGGKYACPQHLQIRKLPSGIVMSAPFELRLMSRCSLGKPFEKLYIQRLLHRANMIKTILHTLERCSP